MVGNAIIPHKKKSTKMMKIEGNHLAISARIYLVNNIFEGLKHGKMQRLRLDVNFVVTVISLRSVL